MASKCHDLQSKSAESLQTRSEGTYVKEVTHSSSDRGIACQQVQRAENCISTMPLQILPAADFFGCGHCGVL